MTVDLDTRKATVIQFMVRVGSTTSSGLLATCDYSDSTAESVIVQYSTNGGVTWSLIATISYASYRTVRQFSANLPIVAKTASTRFRLVQPRFSGANSDQWAIDNFYVASGIGSSLPLRDTFDTGLASFWLVTAFGSVQKYCPSSATGNSLYFPTAGSSGLRYALTKPLKVPSGTIIQFKVCVLIFSSSSL